MTGDSEFIEYLVIQEEVQERLLKRVRTPSNRSRKGILSVGNVEL